ncbi:putative MFS-type transporter EfpA [Streptomyces sp. RB17]|uniref:MFS transporter n=1 Tax=Streptomyces sp. RB17 TaxID=2585197 RepID=UPI0013065EFC|nr:MFS transporter [Streptomyces sp. RB17]MQY39944.1 putative MFS-type transporter EfpA [Streptomyces sp. RB17]
MTAALDRHAGDAQHEKRAGRPRAVMAIACAATFICVLDVSIVNVALPSMRAHLALSPAGLQWVVNGYALTFAGFLLLGGRAADLLGGRRVFLAGLALFTAASMAGGLAQAGWQLVAARFVQGLGGALLVPTTLTLVTTSFTGSRERPRALALLTAAAGSGSALGGVFGGLLTGLLGWRSVLFVNVPAGAGLLLAAAWALRDGPRERTPGGLDLPGSVAVTLGTAGLVGAIVLSEHRGWASGSVLGLLAAALALLAGFVLWERRARDPVVPLDVFRSRPLTLAVVLAALTGGVLPATMFFLSLHLQQVQNMSPLPAGVALLPGAAGVALGAAGASRLVGLLGSRATFLASSLLSAAALAWLSGLTPQGGYAGQVAVALFLSMVGLGAAGLPLTLAAVAGAGPHRTGLASGLLNTAKQIGGAVGLAALVTLAAARTAFLTAEGRVTADTALTRGFGLAFLAAAGIVTLACFVGLALPSRARQEDDPPSGQGRPPRATQ